MEIDAPLILARWTYYGAVTLLFGSSLFPLYAAPGGTARDGVLPRPVVTALATAALAGAALWLMCFATGLAPPEQAGATLRAILFESGFGPAWLVRISALALALLGAVAGRSGAVVLASGVALACEGWSGHAAGFGLTGSLSQVVHVLCAGAWIGGLLPLGVLVARARSDPAGAHVATKALNGFSQLGLPVVLVLVLTGIVNRWHVLAGLPNLTGGYDRVLLAKIILFAAMAALAAANRWRLVPRLRREHRGAAGPLWGNVLAEQLLGAAILLAVSLLGSMDPAA